MNPFPLFLMIQLASGEMLPAQEMSAADCLRMQQEIQTSAKAEAVSFAGKREIVVWATCRPWPPLEACGCDESEEATQ